MQKSKIALVAAALVAATAWAAPALRSEDAPKANKDAPAADASADDAQKVFPFDKGPETIDVSAYPKEQQENYQVFAEKCSKCHTLARPINSPYALPEEWAAYVDKMRHKKRSGIDEDSAKQIVSFLTYDSSIRKKDIIAKKLKEKAQAKDNPQGAGSDSASKPAISTEAVPGDIKVGTP